MIYKRLQAVYIIYRSFETAVNSTVPRIKNGFMTESKWFEDRKILMNPVQGNVKPPISQAISISCNNQEDIATWEKFSDINNLDKRLERAISNLGHSNMSAIQKHTFDILSRRTQDVLASAETGSGKTLAFLAPIINRLVKSFPQDVMKSHNECGGQINFPLFLVIAPTRELVNQICFEAVRLTSYTHFRVCNVIGGVNMKEQRDYLSKGCHGVVATPGRLIDLMKQGIISMRHCDSVVFDEADLMLDMGFEPQIKEIMHKYDMPKCDKLQLSMFSATFPDDVMKLVSTTLKLNYAKILVGSDAGSTVPKIPSNISQTFQLSTIRNINIDVINFLMQNDQKTIVFCNTKKDVMLLVSMAYRVGLRATYLSGDLKQNSRDSNLDEFKGNQANIMFATSVAARGLDVSDIECVVNAQMPNTIDDYIHRAGRCGRMGRAGTTKTFFIDGRVRNEMLRDLKKSLESCGHQIPREILDCSEDQGRVLKSDRGGYNTNRKSADFAGSKRGHYNTSKFYNEF